MPVQCKEERTRIMVA